MGASLGGAKLPYLPHTFAVHRWVLCDHRLRLWMANGRRQLDAVTPSPQQYHETHSPPSLTHSLDSRPPMDQSTKSFNQPTQKIRSRLSLLDSHRVLEETEGIGRGVVGDLEAQRETLLRSRANVREAEGAATKARRLLRTISRRELRHRLCLYLVIVALSAAIVLVLYLKIRRRLS